MPIRALLLAEGGVRFFFVVMVLFCSLLVFVPAQCVASWNSVVAALAFLVLVWRRNRSVRAGDSDSRFTVSHI